MIEQPVKIEVKYLKGLEYFRTSEHGHILRKSILGKDDKIGAINPFGDILWFDENLLVIHLIETPEEKHTP